jgi:hypothetical protein
VNARGPAAAPVPAAPVPATLAAAAPVAAAPVAACRVLVAGAGAGNLKSAVALNLAAALAAAGIPVRLRDLDGASARALAPLGRPDAAAAPPAALRDGRPVGGWQRVRLPWAAADLAVAAPPHAAPDGASDAAPDAVIEIVDPPPRFDAAVRALAATAALVLVPVDASPLALRVLGEVAPVVAAGGGRLRVVLSRRLPRSADRWALVDQLDQLAPDALAPVTLPLARRGDPRAAALYAPGTRGAAAYARLATDVRLLLGLGAVPAVPAAGTAPVSTSA